mmetsp:Transcript_10570/g.17230  ORF Transcript_10570/g.17230 Transcript_10570/m.17230 type:complete len:202 (-) Transcript_10570:434-1039(-)|eukprot:CAMPEP_0174954218 /NCGR_PEP_ID=MMETSP0004_2-20121128/300_1 /TAXON_ID=420556 /ORGANISM="Ochromonas sp., Strain CCMP1393" /LENGTH=201 /DNA_ID=CAMNT_0016202003 /DNA_START=48 /DNA_END=653 /DNA_ORIENTATION=+
MTTRSGNHFSSFSQGVERSDIIRFVGNKLKSKRVKAATVVSYCENLDRNGDSCIHIGDLTHVLQHLCGRNSFSAREMQHLAPHLQSHRTLNGERGTIDYMKFLDIFTDSLSYTSDYNKADDERWQDGTNNGLNTRWATKRGSVGEWLQNAACPAEVENFRKFIGCLEEYERCSGLKLVQKEDGFVVPLGPDLKASISFYMK